MSSHVIQALGLTKKYGNFYAVQSLDLALDEGDVFGFIGPNGAGKTTTLNMLVGMLKPTKGNAYLLNKDIKNNMDALRQEIGLCP